MLAYFNGTQTDLTGGYVSTEKCQTGQYGKVAVNQHVDQVRSKSNKVGQGQTNEKLYQVIKGHIHVHIAGSRRRKAMFELSKQQKQGHSTH